MLLVLPCALQNLRYPQYPNTHLFSSFVLGFQFLRVFFLLVLLLPFFIYINVCLSLNLFIFSSFSILCSKLSKYLTASIGNPSFMVRFCILAFLSSAHFFSHSTLNANSSIL